MKLNAMLPINLFSKGYVCTKHEVVLHGYFSSNFSTWEAFGSSVNTTLEMFA